MWFDIFRGITFASTLAYFDDSVVLGMVVSKEWCRNYIKRMTIFWAWWCYVPISPTQGTDWLVICSNTFGQFPPPTKKNFPNVILLHLCHRCLHQDPHGRLSAGQEWQWEWKRLMVLLQGRQDNNNNNNNNNNKVNQMFDRNPSSVKGKLRKVLSRSPGSVFSNCNHMPSIIHHFAKCRLRQHYVQDFFVAHLSPAYLPTNRSDFLKSAIRSFLTRHCWLVGRFPTWLLCVNFVSPLGRCLGCPHVSNVATPCCKMPFWPPMMSFCHLSF